MFNWFLNLFNKKKEKKYIRKIKNLSKKRYKLNRKIIHKYYCRSCHKYQVFKENRSGHFHCIKCGWRNPEDW